MRKANSVRREQIFGGKKALRNGKLALLEQTMAHKDELRDAVERLLGALRSSPNTFRSADCPTLNLAKLLAVEWKVGGESFLDLLTDVRKAPGPVIRNLIVHLGALAVELEHENDSLRGQLADFQMVTQNRPKEIQELVEAAGMDEFLRSLCQLVESIKTRRLAKKGQPEVLSPEQKRQRTKAAKSRYEERRLFDNYRRGLIEEQFAGPDEWSPIHGKPVPATGDCLDELLKGGHVKMSGSPNCMEDLFGVERHHFPPKVKGKEQGREQFYDDQAFLKIAEHLLNAGKWLADPEKRARVLHGIQFRIEEGGHRRVKVLQADSDDLSRNTSS